MNRQEMAELIRQVRTDDAALPLHPNEVLSVPHVLAGLADAWPEALMPEHRRQIDTLCRKISASGALCVKYNTDWTRCKDAEPLPGLYQLLLSAVLLAWSEVPDAMEPDGRGLSLKCLNGALCAADAYKSMRLSGSGEPHSASYLRLRTWIDERLAKVVCEVGG